MADRRQPSLSLAAGDGGTLRGRWLAALAALLLLGVGAVTWLLLDDRDADAGDGSRVVQAEPIGATGGGFTDMHPPMAAVTPEPAEHEPERLIPDSARLGQHHLVLARAAAESRTTTFVVLDEGGRRVAGAQVSVWSLPRLAPPNKKYDLPILDLGPLDGPPPRRVFADEVGEVRVTAPRGHDFAVAAEAPDVGSSGLLVPGRRWLRFSGKLLPRNPAQRPLVEELVLHPRARLEGRVLGRDGQPAAGVKLAVVAGPVEEGANRTSPRDPGTHLTEADGRFRIEVDAPAGVSLDAVLPGGGLLDAWARVHPGEVWSRTLYGPGAVVVTGRVVTETGDPVRQAVVMAMAVQGPAKVGEARTDVTGRFTLDLTRDGEFDLYAFSGGRVQREVPALTTSDDRVPGEARITMLRGSTLEGSLALKDGRPVPQGFPRMEVRAMPRVSSRGLPPPQVRYLFSLQRTVRARPDGTFTLLSIHPEYDYDLSVAYENDDGTWARGQATATPGAGPVKLVLEGPLVRTDDHRRTHLQK